jgi:hypothetical protein
VGAALEKIRKFDFHATGEGNARTTQDDLQGVGAAIKKHDFILNCHLYI